MFRTSTAVAFLWLCLVPFAWAQGAPAKPAAKGPEAKTSATAKPTISANGGACRYGVVTATENVLTVQKVGLTVFGNDYAEVPVSWGFDDLIFARARAAAGAIPVRRITYAKGAFDSYYHPQSKFFRNARQELTDIVRQIARHAGCERYLVFTRFEAQLQGTNQTLNGIGVLSRGAGIITSTWLFANVGVLDFDGQTFEIRKNPHANLEAVLARMVANLTSDESLRKVDNSAFPASPAEAANSAILRDGVRNFLTERLNKYLPAYFKE